MRFWAPATVAAFCHEGAVARCGGPQGAWRIAARPGGALEIDTVNNLILAQGDGLDLAVIDAGSGALGDQAFHLVDAFTHHVAELIRTFSAGTTTLQLDGDGLADYRMNITGDVRLDSGGWVL